MGENFPFKEFLLGALVPIFIYYIFDHLHQTLLGAILATCWGVTVAIISYLFLEKTNLFAMLSLPCSIIELTCILVTQNQEFYLIWPAIEKTLWGCVYIGSVLISRPLILILAQAMGMCPKTENLGEFGATKQFQSAWNILTVIWGGANLITATLLVVSHLWLPLEAYLVVRGASGNPLLAALIGISVWFPEWYWKRNQINKDADVSNERPEIVV